MSNSSVFKVRLKVLRSSADRHLYDSEFQIEGALSPTTLVSPSVQIVTIYQMSVMCVLVGSDGLIETGKPVDHVTGLAMPAG